MICDPFVNEKNHVKYLLWRHNITLGTDEEFFKRYHYQMGMIQDKDGHKMRNMGASPKRRVVYLSDTNTTWLYLASLHEIGHIVHPQSFAANDRTQFMWQNTPDYNMGVLDSEAYAWEWAIKHAMYDLTEDDMDEIMSCVRSYWEEYHDGVQVNKLHPIFKSFANENQTWKQRTMMPPML